MITKNSIKKYILQDVHKKIKSVILSFDKEFIFDHLLKAYHIDSLADQIENF